MDLSEVLWTDSFRIGNVYQVPDNSYVRKVLANQHVITI